MSKSDAGRVNLRRLVAGGLLAGLVLNAGEMLLEPVVGAEAAAWLEALGGRMPEGGALAVFLLMGFLIGLVTVWIYAAIRPRFGPGPRTALLAATPVWFLACVTPTVALASYGLLPSRLLLAWILWPLIQVPAAALAGAWVYREAVELPRVAAHPTGMAVGA